MPRISFGTPLKGVKKPPQGSPEDPGATPDTPSTPSEGGRSPSKAPGKPADGSSGGGKGKILSRRVKAPKTQPGKAPSGAPEPSEEERREIELLEAVADAADLEGMYAQDMIRFPEILLRRGLDPRIVTHGLAHRADQLNRQQINELLGRYNRSHRETYDALGSQ